MTTEQVYRLSGGALLTGALLAAISSIASGALLPDPSDPAVASSANIALNTLSAVGSLLALFGLPAMYLRHMGSGGAPWLVGVLLIGVTAVLFGIFMNLMGALVFPVLAEEAPQLLQLGPPAGFFVLFIVGGLANFLGALLMGIPMLSKRLYSHWCGIAMLVEAAFALVGFAVNGPNSSGVLAQIFNIVSPLPLFAVLVWAGYELASGAAHSAPVLTRQRYGESAP